MLDVSHLEIHVAHACNLTCESCSHYSDQGHKGVVALEDADRWMNAWSRRLRPETFSLVGGEPTIHPRLAEFFQLARRHWPDSHLRLVTNGFFVHNHPHLPLVMRGDPRAHIYLSIHHQSREYLEKLSPNYDLLKSWVRDFGIDVRYYRSFARWRRTYRGSGHSMLPYEDNDPRRSWENCDAKGCPQLFEAKIWKCSPLTYLRMQHAKYHLSDAWSSYLDYEPLDSKCGEAELEAFFSKEEESYCSMCPAAPARFEMPIPLRRAVSTRA